MRNFPSRTARSVRRTAAALLLAAPAVAPGRAAAQAPAGMGVSVAVREQTADEQVQHVLNRLAFGPRPGDPAAVRAVGVDEWIAAQLAPARAPDTAVTRLVASYEMLAGSTPDFLALYNEGQRALRAQGRAATATAAGTAADSASRREMRIEMLRGDPEARERTRRTQRVVRDVQSARVARAVIAERQLDEVMTDFWHNHFSVFAGKGLTRFFVPAYDRDVIRPRAMGSFRDLLGAVAKSPAMLFYLDQWQSAADTLHPTLVEVRRPGARRPPALARRGLNENYARELLELHTLGVDGGYTQQDVIETARALTGWTMAARTTGEFAFTPAIHDAGAKTVLGVQLKPGRGIADGEQVLDIVARHPSTARHIAHKLAVRFVSDAPPEALVARAAETFTRTDGDIRETVRAIVTSPEFFSRSAYRAKVKSPFELVVSAARAVGAAADTSFRSAQMVAFLGQPVFGRQTPNGWPETGESWMNSGAILNRINFGTALAAGRLPGASVAAWSEGARLRTAPREAQVEAVVSAFLGGRASPDTREILLSGVNPLAARGTRTAEAPAAPAAPEAMMAPAPRLAGLPQLVGLAIGSPEFQRR